MSSNISIDSHDATVDSLTVAVSKLSVDSSEVIPTIKSIDSLPAVVSVDSSHSQLTQTQAVKPIDSSAVKSTDSSAVKPIDSSAVKPIDSSAVKPGRRRKYDYSRNERGEFICTICGENKGYNQSTMTYHMKKHEGAKSYACTVDGCDKTFIQKSGLTQHMALVHADVAKALLSCPLCDYATSSKANLVIHVGRNHCESWIPQMKGAGCCTCSSCDKVCLSSTAYYYHAVQCFVAPKEMEEHLVRIIGTPSKTTN